ncbi:STAS domain-containing protein [Streptomyces sp. NPDC102467]|uniref:STAS domain-containing protein n=1 Tax=Streptomyces sp. NPDC102467 TaxID=3366179 RepID=UPI0037F6B66F
MSGVAGGTDRQRSQGLRMALKRTPITADYFMTLDLDGELDTGSIPALCELTSQVLAEGSRHLIMDLSAVTRCDEASFYTLLGIRQAIHHAGGSLTLANPSRCVHDALSRSVLQGQLPLHDLHLPAHEPPQDAARDDGSAPAESPG